MSAFPTIVGGLVAAIAVGAVVVDHGIYRRFSQKLDRSVYCGAQDRRAVALTFDDGPGPQTLELLAYLAAEGIRATFFQCGMLVERYPEIARQVHAAGHEIGNHAYSHRRLSPHVGRSLHLPTPQFMYRELAQTQRLLTSVCGTAPKLFRPPYGHRWIGLDAVQRRLGMRGIQWTVIGHDWEWPAARIAERVLSRVVPGAIICLHDGRDIQPSADISEMMKALRLIVPALRAQGYSFETVGELLQPKAVRQSVLVG